MALSRVDLNCPQHSTGAAKTFRQSHSAEDCPAKPPGEALEPVSLAVLAEAIRDEAWIDVVLLEVGIVRRVKPLKLVCRRDGDDVEVVQAWPEGNTVNHTNHTFDADLLIKVRPTQVALLDVKPLVEPEPPVPPRAPLPTEAEAIITEIIRTVAWTNSVSEDGIRAPMNAGRPSYAALRPRQEAMWLTYEMTNLPPPTICQDHFGYRSQQPLTTIADKIRWSIQNNKPVIYGEQPRAWVKRVREKAAVLDAHFGVRFRRDTTSPGWTTIL